jgi:hypothetical protein
LKIFLKFETFRSGFRLTTSAIGVSGGRKNATFFAAERFSTNPGDNLKEEREK